MSTSNTAFLDGLIAEALKNLQGMSEAARQQAVIIEAQASMVAHLIEARRSADAPQPASVLLEIDYQSLQMQLRDMMATTITEWSMPGGPLNRQGAPIHQQPQTIIPGEEGSTIHRTREGREIQPLSPIDEPKTQQGGAIPDPDKWVWPEPAGFADVSADQLVREGVVIVEKEIEPVPENTTLDASGRLVEEDPYVPAVQGFVPPPDFAAIERMRLEDEARNQQAEIDHVRDLRTEPMEDLNIEPKPEPEPEPALQPDTPAQVVHKAQKAVDPWPDPKPAAGNAKAETAQDRVLNHYAANGFGYEETAHVFELSPSTIASYISTGRGRQDPRAAQGDLKRLAREEDETTALRNVLIGDAKSRNGEIVFPDDNMIGVAAYRVNYGEGVIEAPEGNLPLSKAWLRIMDLLKDRDEHPTDDVWNAGRFPNERSVLKNLKTINEALAQVKLFIVAEAKTYQLASLR